MLIGSRAAQMHFPDFRKPKDWDYLSTEDFAPGVEVFWHETFPCEWNSPVIASPEFLYTLKVSHAFWDLHGTWNKHMGDIVYFQRKGLEFNRGVYDIVLPIWKQMHGAKRNSLNLTKADFFADAVDRKYDHDSIHDSVAYGDVPMYTRILQDGSEVLVDSSKFWAMTHADKIKTIREEVYATALERWVIPSEYRVSPRAAYARALKKAITSLFKNDWALFIVLNYNELLAPDHDYVSHHKTNSHRLITL